MQDCIDTVVQNNVYYKLVKPMLYSPNKHYTIHYIYSTELMHIQNQNSQGASQSQGGANAPPPPETNPGNVTIYAIKNTPWSYEANQKQVRYLLL